MAITGTPPDDRSLRDYIQDYPVNQIGDKPRKGQPPKQPTSRDQGHPFSAGGGYLGGGGGAPLPACGPIGAPVHYYCWHWHGFNWKKATGCDANGSLVIAVNCSEIDATEGLLPGPVTQAVSLISNTNYPYTLTQSAIPSVQNSANTTVNTNGYQMPHGIFGSSYSQPNINGFTGCPGGVWGTNPQGHCINGLGAEGKHCVSVAYNAAAYPGQQTDGPGNYMRFDFSLQDSQGNFMPMTSTNPSTTCHIMNNPLGPITPGWVCSDLGGGIYSYVGTIYRNPGAGQWGGFSGDYPEFIEYKDLPAGDYTFNWISVTSSRTYSNPTNAVHTHYISPSSATFTVEYDTTAPTSPFLQMPYAYKNGWPHWNLLNYSPHAIITTPQYNWLVNQNLWNNNFQSGGTNMPQGYLMKNMTANVDYPNKVGFCEYCRDWQLQGNVTGTGLWIGTPNTWGQLSPGVGGPAWNWIGPVAGSGSTYTHYSAGTIVSGTGTGTAVYTYKTNNIAQLLVEAEAMCECCPRDSQGLYTTPPDPGLGWAYPPTGTWMGPSL